jgi:hypothetical protein
VSFRRNVFPKHKLSKLDDFLQDKEMIPDAAALDALGERPDDETYLKMGKFNILACRLGPGG